MNNQGWILITPPLCDYCDNRATWQHPMGGICCSRCLFAMLDGKKEKVLS